MSSAVRVALLHGVQSHDYASSRFHMKHEGRDKAADCAAARARRGGHIITAHRPRFRHRAAVYAHDAAKQRAQLFGLRLKRRLYHAYQWPLRQRQRCTRGGQFAAAHRPRRQSYWASLLDGQFHDGQKSQSGIYIDVFCSCRRVSRRRVTRFAYAPLCQALSSTRLADLRSTHAYLRAAQTVTCCFSSIRPVSRDDAAIPLLFLLRASHACVDYHEAGFAFARGGVVR